MNNAIQFRAGNAAQPVKYSLSLLNYSTEPGAEGLFYKFKVVMTAEEQNTLLSSLDSDARVYELSGIELSRNGTMNLATVELVADIEVSLHKKLLSKSYASML